MYRLMNETIASLKDRILSNIAIIIKIVIKKI